MDILTQNITVRIEQTPPVNVRLAGVQGIAGANGLSAYEIAVKNGFSGSEQEWLRSLHGDAENYDQLLELVRHITTFG